MRSAAIAKTTEMSRTEKYVTGLELKAGIHFLREVKRQEKLQIIDLQIISDYDFLNFIYIAK